jgi:hypothetical protein
MTQPTWATPAGNIGTYVENIAVNFQFNATPSSPSNTLVFTLLNGVLPTTTDINAPMTISSAGLLSGIPAQVSSNTTSSFTIRVTEYQGAIIVGFRDRTFSITISGTTSPTFITAAGLLSTINDSTWYNFQIQYNNPDPNTTSTLTVDSGSLPPGLQMNSLGLIRGYANPPVNQSDQPITQTYTFTVLLESASGTASRTFQITVINQETIPGFIGRVPTILNNRPLTFDTTNSEFASYYFTSSSIGNYKQDNQLIFKIIGYDFDGDELSYEIIGLNLIGSLTYNTSTGWINGVLPTIGSIANTYNITARVYKTSNSSITSSVFSFTITVIGSIDTTITWVSDSDLGSIINGEISTQYIAATAAADDSLAYTLINGTLPPTLSLSSTGEIVGRLAFESTNTVQFENQERTYTFTARAQSILYPYITTNKTFTITTIQKNTTPYDNIYIKALLSQEQRDTINLLLNDTTIIPEEALYRSTDFYFGRAKDIRYQHMFGIPSSVTTDYIAAVQENHYVRNLVLGELQTAVARNEQGEIIYEVVYSKVIDDLFNNNGISISSSIRWPRLIPPNITVVYPASLYTMQQRLEQELGKINDSSILPLWMTSQQQDKNIIGFIYACVLCYTKPGYSETIVQNINNYWPYKLNQFQFTIDRFEVDKSLVYQYNTTTETWSALPSSVNNSENYDLNIYFPYNILS